MKRIGFLIVDSSKYASPKDNPYHSFKSELSKMAGTGNVILEPPLEFTSPEVFITTFNRDGVMVQNNIINRTYSYEWMQLSISICRKIYFQISGING